MFKCDCIDPVFFHRRGRKARREGIFDYLCDLCALSGEMWVITNFSGLTRSSHFTFHAQCGIIMKPKTGLLTA